MFKETKCPVCNTLMIGVSANWGDSVMYMCPTHSFTESIGKATGGVHMSENLLELYKDKAEDIRRAIFVSLKD